MTAIWQSDPTTAPARAALTGTTGPPQTPDDVILDVVRKASRDVDISQAITGGELERTMEGASTLTLQVLDAHRVLLRSPDLQRKIDLEYDGNWWRLVKVSKSGDAVTLTFEDRDVAFLRTHTKPRKVARDKMTRAEFVRSLAREVKASHIDFYSPEVHERQPIGKAAQDAKPKRRKESDRQDRRQKGLMHAAGLTVKGVRATAEQRRNAQRVLDVADTLKAGPKATEALMIAVIAESLIKNLTGGDASSVGILQLLSMHLHGSTSTHGGRRDIELVCRMFLRDGFTGPGGAMKLASKNPSWDAADVTATVQGNRDGAASYRPWIAEARKWIAAYGGPTGTDTGGVSGSVRHKRYEFTRGQAGKKEDSWTAIQRLADEVRWRAFMDNGRLYFVSEDRLITSQARYVISEDDDGVNWIDFDVDQGKVGAELTVSCRAGLFAVRVGSVMAVQGLGIANGRYLVSSVRRSLFSTDTEITLKAPTPKLPEPEAERIEVRSKSKRPKVNGSASGKSASLAGRNLPDEVVRAYKRVDFIDSKNYRYLWAGGHNATFSGPFDCSGFVSSVLHAAGLLSSAMSTVGLKDWGKLGEGKFMTVWVHEVGIPHQSHTFMTFTLDGLGHGEQKFAEAGGNNSAHTGWHSSRNKAGFVPRHWPGT